MPSSEHLILVQAHQNLVPQILFNTCNFKPEDSIQVFQTLALHLLPVASKHKSLESHLGLHGAVVTGAWLLLKSARLGCHSLTNHYNCIHPTWCHSICSWVFSTELSSQHPGPLELKAMPAAGICYHGSIIPTPFTQIFSLKPKTVVGMRKNSRNLPTCIDEDQVLEKL